MTKKEKFHLIKSGVISYGVCSVIGYLKHGGIVLTNHADAYSVKFYKSLGVIDFIRMNGHLKDMRLFSDDGVLLLVGIGTTFIIMGYSKLVEFIQSMNEDSGEKRAPKRPSRPAPVIRDFSE